MTKSILVRLTACLSSILSIVSCSDQKASSGPCNADDPGCLAVGGGNGTGGASSTTGGVTAAGGVTSTGTTTTNATTTGGASSATGGTTAHSSTGSTGGSTSSTGGKTSTGGTSATGGSSSTKATGGTTANGGSSGTKTIGGTSATGGSSSTKATGGTTANGGSSGTTTGGTNATGGTLATGGSMAATGGVAVDEGGKTLAKAGDKTSTTNDYLYLGNMRLLNNNWGSVELNNSGKSCNAPQSVQVNSDGSLGWSFNRGGCGDDGSHPDYPELEFGVGPFGSGSSLLTSPEYSSTTLLPIQVKDIQSATAVIDNFAINLQGGSNWNLNIEFWLSRNNPLTNSDGGVYAEFMGVWGWNTAATWWNCTPALNQSVTSGGKSYNLCHQSDSWGSTWRFFQFTGSGGSQHSFTGTVDIKAFLDWFYGSSYAQGASKDLWLTRIELGTEIGDSTSGTCSIKNISFNINGTTQGPVLAK